MHSSFFNLLGKQIDKFSLEEPQLISIPPYRFCPIIHSINLCLMSFNILLALYENIIQLILYYLM